MNKRPAPVPKEQSGQWVYIIGYGKSGLVKIGTTTRPKQRVASLQATSIENLEVLAHFPGGRKLERQLHELFAEQRVWNEFFRHDELLGSFLRNIEFTSLPDAIAHIEEQKAWLRRPESERRAIERMHREAKRRATIIPIYPHDWNDARLEANRQKQRERVGGGAA